VRQASLLEELREACGGGGGGDGSAKDASGAAASGYGEFLASIAEAQDRIKLPPSFILNLVKGKSVPYTLEVLPSVGCCLLSALKCPYVVVSECRWPFRPSG